MSGGASVVIPVKDGARYLEEVLAAVLAQEPGLEVLVIDSGSRDGSPAIARAAGVELLEIEPATFGHGRTRNLGAERTSGELICFLTQDATPLPGWLAAFREALALEERVGAAFGPHLPRPDTSPMIARELTEFFAGFTPTGGPALQHAGGEPFLSNVNACYRRDCWEEVRFDDVAYSEDQAFGRAMLAAGWAKAYHPGAAVLHAHDYPPVDFMRRYFDEYRGLRESSGPRRGLRAALDGARRARRWWRPTGAGWTSRAWRRASGRAGRRARPSTTRAARSSPRSARAPSGSRRRRSARSRSRAARRPGRRRRSGRARARAPRRARARRVGRRRPRSSAFGEAPLLEPVPGMADAERLHVAVVIPHFRRGSGGHSTIFNLLTRLEERGHLVSTWLHDPVGYMQRVPGGGRARRPARVLPPAARAGVQGLRRVARRRRRARHGLGHGLPRAAARPGAAPAPTSCRTTSPSSSPPRPRRCGRARPTRRACTASPPGRGCATCSPTRYGATASSFDLGVDHDVYRPRPVTRREDTIVFYARHVTPRRGVPLGLQALAEVHRRRPGHPLRALRRHEAGGCRSRTSSSGSPRRRSSPGRTPRRPSASRSR